jgi:hypothetical protein
MMESEKRLGSGPHVQYLNLSSTAGQAELIAQYFFGPLHDLQYLVFLLVIPIPHWPLPTVRDLTRDGRWSTYDVSVFSTCPTFHSGESARMGNTLKLPSPTKLAWLGHFPPASQAGPLAGLVFYVYAFSLVIP